MQRIAHYALPAAIAAVAIIVIVLPLLRNVAHTFESLANAVPQSYSQASH